jgi:hypothetical protein
MQIHTRSVTNTRLLALLQFQERRRVSFAGLLRVKSATAQKLRLSFEIHRFEADVEPHQGDPFRFRPGDGHPYQAVIGRSFSFELDPDTGEALGVSGHSGIYKAVRKAARKAGMGEADVPAVSGFRTKAEMLALLDRVFHVLPTAEAQEQRAWTAERPVPPPLLVVVNSLRAQASASGRPSCEKPLEPNDVKVDNHFKLEPTGGPGIIGWSGKRMFTILPEVRARGGGRRRRLVDRRPAEAALTAERRVMGNARFVAGRQEGAHVEETIRGGVGGPFGIHVSVSLQMDLKLEPAKR